MVPMQKFEIRRTRYQNLIQPGCPVSVHCVRLCLEPRSRGTFLQMRLVNRSDRCLTHVFLRVEGMGPEGSLLFSQDEVILGQVHARPREAFGEDRLVSLLGREPSEVRVLVIRVVYEDGQLWRMLPEDSPVNPEAAGWKRCSCGLWNTPDAPSCVLCGAAFVSEEIESVPEPAEPEVREEAPLRPQEPEEVCPREEVKPPPVIREEYQHRESHSYPEYGEEQGGIPGWLLFIICFFGTLFAVSLGLLAVFYLKNYFF